ncbi:MipA/OmpV family protein [Niveispirillum fermenti]|uniref:MipA/OmpV family protein n=1 Tax=Niveispirillum fermenti TaxID=1233113 RepID=UPI003A889267
MTTRSPSGRLHMAAAIAALLAVTTISPAVAGPADPDDRWSIRLGAVGFVMPEYQGSDSYKLRPLPDIDISYDDRYFLSRMGLGANVLNGGPLTVGAAIGFDGGRSSGKHPALRGYRGVGDTAVGRVFIEYDVGPLGLSADITTDVLGRGHKGTTVTLGAGYIFKFATGTGLLISPSLTWASGDYMHRFFSTTTDRLRPVDPADPVTPGSAVGYKAGSGFKDAGLMAILIQPLDKNWSVTGFVGYARMLGDAADSPFVKDNGSRNQFTGGMGLAYTF